LASFLGTILIRRNGAGFHTGLRYRGVAIPPAAELPTLDMRSVEAQRFHMSASKGCTPADVQPFSQRFGARPEGSRVASPAWGIHVRDRLTPQSPRPLCRSPARFERSWTSVARHALLSSRFSGVQTCPVPWSAASRHQGTPSDDEDAAHLLRLRLWPWDEVAPSWKSDPFRSFSSPIFLCREPRLFSAHTGRGSID